MARRMTMKMTDRKKQAIAAVDNMADELQAMSSFIHANPEMGGEEYQASGLLVAAALKQGFRITRNISGFDTAFVAEKGDSGPHIAFLAEYDALPGLGHACGHNLIAAMSFGAAAAFAAAAESEAVSCLIGCPAEETWGAKVKMSADGVFDGLTAALVLHPASTNAMGGTSYASHPLRITFRGRSSHVAAKDDKGVNALDALILFYQELKQLKQSFDRETILAGIITKGGTAPNIIPAEAEADFTLRALTADYLEDSLVPAVRELADDVARRTGTTVSAVHYEPLYKELINDARLMALFRENMALLGEVVTVLAPGDADGSTDVGNVSHSCPTIHPDIGIGCDAAAHTPEFAIAAASTEARQRLLIGAKVMAMTALDLL